MSVIYTAPERADELADRVIGGVLPVEVAIAIACRVAVAEELRRQAEFYGERAQAHHCWAERAQSEVNAASAIASYNEVAGVAVELRRRANELDPEGATR